MAIRKNKKFIDPRYFMDEKTETTNEGWEPKWYNKGTRDKEDVYIGRGSRGTEPETDEERAHRRAKEAREDERRREDGLPPIKSKYFEEGFDSPEWANFDNKMVPKEVVAQVRQTKGEAWWKRNVVHPGVDRVTDMKQALGPWNKDDPDYDPNDLKRFGLA